MSRKGKSISIVLEKGDTFWRLSEKRYDGKHPIDAIFQANGLIPNVVYRNDLRILVDPVYHAGNAYIFPAWSQVGKLQERFWRSIDEKHPPVKGEFASLLLDPDEPAPDERTRAAVVLRWDDTFWSRTRAFYRDNVPAEAIFELNGLEPRKVIKDDSEVYLPPLYGGGRTYLLPAICEIASLTESYRSRCTS